MHIWLETLQNNKFESLSSNIVKHSKDILYKTTRSSFYFQLGVTEYEVDYQDKQTHDVHQNKPTQVAIGCWNFKSVTSYNIPK